MIKLDIGCGQGKKPGFIGIDIKPPADVIMDVCKNPLPFKDNSIDEIYCSHVMEHIEDPVFVIREIFRVLKRGKFFICQYPHFSTYKAYNQYHKNHFSGILMDFYDEKSNLIASKRLNEAKFKIIKKQIMTYKTLILPYTYIIAEIAKFYPDFYEKFLCYLAPAYNVRLICKKS